MIKSHKQCDIALTNAGGDRALAAVALGKTVRAVEMMISHSEELKWKWRNGTKGPPTQAQTLHRQAASIPPMSETEKSLVTGMAKEDALLADGLDKLGLTPKESALAVQLAAFNNTQFVSSVNISAAGMTRVGILIQTQIDEIVLRLTDVREKIKAAASAIQRSEYINEERYLMKGFVEMTEQIKRINDASHRSMMLIASIRYRLSGRRSGGEFKMPKPGYSASLPIDVAPTPNGEPNQP